MCVVSLALSVLTPEASDRGLKQFRNFKWGQKPSKNMTPLRMKRGSMDVYYIYNDENRIAGRDVGLLNYLFYKNRLCVIDITWQLMRQSDFEVTGKVLAGEWGIPDEVLLSGDVHRWRSRDENTEATLRLVTALAGMDPRRATEMMMVTLQIGDRKCGDAARADTGLSK
jgi:hypothetical protein